MKETMELLIINFGLSGIGEADYRTVCDQLAPAFADVPGLATKVWLADTSRSVALACSNGRPPATLVGRDTELATLRRVLDPGGPRVCFV